MADCKHPNTTVTAQDMGRYIHYTRVCTSCKAQLYTWTVAK